MNNTGTLTLRITNLQKELDLFYFRDKPEVLKNKRQVKHFATKRQLDWKKKIKQKGEFLNEVLNGVIFTYKTAFAN